MNTTITIALPYQQRHLNTELKARGGRFNPKEKIWELPDNPENRDLVETIKPKSLPAQPGERITAVAKTAVDLLNALKVGEYALIEASTEQVLIRAKVRG